MKAYPVITGELDTLRLVCEGRSLARYGDGEFNICLDRPAKKQRHDARLSGRLRDILKDSGECLVGIPNLHSDTPKAEFWRKYETSANLLAGRSYVSSFVTRPDSAPWINTAEYWSLLQSLWVGQDVTLVRGSDKSLTEEDLVGAGAVTEIFAHSRDAWNGYDALLEHIGTPKRALICLGPTATVLAVDLCARGVHAIDLGHVGLFLRKSRLGHPMIVTDEDKAA